MYLDNILYQPTTGTDINNRTKLNFKCPETFGTVQTQMVPIGFEYANMYVTSHENVTFHDETLAIIAVYLF